MKNQTTHNAEYMQAIFSAIIRIIEEPATVASNTNRLRLIQQLSYIGHEGAVIGTGPEDFDSLAISDWLEDIEAGRNPHAGE